jgi:surfeit locus 1 family protein
MTGMDASPATRNSKPLRSVAFVVLMLALTILFAALGAWQWQRLAEKEALVATVESRMGQRPTGLPAADLWDGLDTEYYDYRPLTVSGRYLPEQSVLVFTSLSAPKGDYSGPGFWVMTPLALEDGGTIFVNRGFVPQQSGPAFAKGGAVPQGTVTLTGIGRAAEEAQSFTPGADTAMRIEWVRNTERLARFADPSGAPFAPLYLDMPAGDAGALPQGGETVVEFPNNHLGYALTWFGFALLTPILLVFWLARSQRARPEP